MSTLLESARGFPVGMVADILFSLTECPLGIGISRVIGWIYPAVIDPPQDPV